MRSGLGVVFAPRIFSGFRFSMGTRRLKTNEMQTMLIRISAIVVGALSALLIVDLWFNSHHQERGMSAFERDLIENKDFEGALDRQHLADFTAICAWDITGAERYASADTISRIRRVERNLSSLTEDGIWTLIFLNGTGDFESVIIHSMNIPIGIEGNCCCFSINQIEIEITSNNHFLDFFIHHSAE